jgi:hypothetical protein
MVTSSRTLRLCQQPENVIHKVRVRWPHGDASVQQLALTIRRISIEQSAPN